MNLYDAMTFARTVHSGHRRRYTGDPYAVHLAEVAAITAALGLPIEAQCIAWLHDSIEDVGVTHADLLERFGATVADGVLLLSDLEKGNRAARKAAARQRLATAPSMIQAIKCADIASNASSIQIHDSRFWPVYREECLALVSALSGATCAARQIALASLEASPHLLVSSL